jgi:hypothetical protein
MGQSSDPKFVIFVESVARSCVVKMKKSSACFQFEMTQRSVVNNTRRMIPEGKSLVKLCEQMSESAEVWIRDLMGCRDTHLKVEYPI